MTSNFIANMTWNFRKPWAAGDEKSSPIDSIEPLSTSNSSSEAHHAEKKNPAEREIDITSAAEDIPKLAKSHRWDPNLPQDKIGALHDASATGDVEAIKEVETAFVEDSPYEEVRAAVRPTDPEGPANTVRAWVLGMVFVTVCSGLNMFLSMRYGIS